MMRLWPLFLIFGLGSELNRQQQRHNPNSDFLLHESGSNLGQAKRDYVAQPTRAPNLLPAWSQDPQHSSSKTDYNLQFPSLGVTTPRPSPLSGNTQSSGKRDYVAPQKPIQGPTPTISTSKASFPPSASNSELSSGKRDYVSSQIPAFRPSQEQTQAASNTGGRDYVAPQFPALAPQGNVKNLINFYNNKPTDTSSKVPSYSSILQGGTSKPGASVTKPSSFSTAAGSNIPASVTTPKTGISSKPSGFSTGNTGTSFIPSSIVNREQGQTSNSNSATDSELQNLSEELLSKDTNNAGRLITINYQAKTTSQSNEDKAPLPLLTLTPEVWNLPTIQKFVPLLDNYERDTLVNEYVTPQERNEENAFMDAIMSTSVIRHLMNFLKDKGFVTPDPKQQRDFLKQLWFGLYSRGQGKVSSSGFEHVFVSELKNGEVLGLHNWIYFAKEEAANRINYLGYMAYTPLNDKGAVIKLHLTQQGVNKPVNTLFIGTSPELEMALYTLCFVTRVDTECKLKLGGKDVDITTFKFRYRSKNYIGSAYPK